MTTPLMIADALTRVRAAADIHKSNIVRTEDISRADRELLTATGWLQEIIRGWYMLVRPDVATGDTAAWYANFWDFVRLYLTHRFGDVYCLSAESSLDCHLQNPTVPKQVIVIVKHGAGLRTLMHNTSLMMYTENKNFPEEIIKINGINAMTLPFALCKVSPTYFQSAPREAELALKWVESADELCRMIVKYHLKNAAARLMGAYLFLNNQTMADDIKTRLKSIGLLVSPENPFANNKPLLMAARVKSPVAGRIEAMWAQARERVIKYFPAPLGLPQDKALYMKRIDNIYQFDAYHSLSIEGYQVSETLINKVKNDSWDPVNNHEDANLKNAMAAKGYFEAFQAVKVCIERIINDESAPILLKQQLQGWFQKLFSPSVNAGILPAEALFGYRQDRVFIRNSRHTPPSKECVPDAMQVFFECLANEPHAGVRAVLGHYFFVYIHPYMDGNGRLGRFIMNAMLASGGYPWTVIRVENRDKYLALLEKSHTTFDLSDFTKFIARAMSEDSKRTRE